jgi:hypothetical protein
MRGEEGVKSRIREKELESRVDAEGRAGSYPGWFVMLCANS